MFKEYIAIARIIALMTVAAITKSVYAADLTASAVHGFWRGHDLKAPGLLYVSLVIRNDTNKSVRIPTRYTVDGMLNKRSKYILNLLVKSKRFYDVTPVVPEGDLRIVELKPGDIAWISWKQAYDELPKMPIYVRFVVDKDIAERYNLWCGELEVKSGIDSERKTAFEVEPHKPAKAR